MVTDSDENSLPRLGLKLKFAGCKAAEGRLIPISPAIKILLSFGGPDMDYFFLDYENPGHTGQINISNIRDGVDEPRLLPSILTLLGPDFYRRPNLLIKIGRRDRPILVAPAEITDDKAFGYSSLSQR